MSFFSSVLAGVWAVSKPSSRNVPLWPFAKNLWERKRERKGKSLLAIGNDTSEAAIQFLRRTIVALFGALHCTNPQLLPLTSKIKWILPA